MKKPFRDRVKEGPIVGDGAMGTLLDLYGFVELPPGPNKYPKGFVTRLHRW